MSYCVQCGVQLAKNLDRCPLCKTQVINPNQAAADENDNEHPDRVEKAIARIDRGYARQLSIISTLIPMLIVLLLDILDGGSAWSPYVLGALAMAWCFLAVPLLFRVKRPYLYVVLDVLALCGYLALIAAMSNDFSWYLSIVLPLLVLIGIVTLLLLLIIRRIEMLKLFRASLVLLVLACFVIGLEVIIDLSLDGKAVPGWSIYTSTPLLVIALMVFGLQHNKALKEEIRKRLFI